MTSTGFSYSLTTELPCQICNEVPPPYRASARLACLSKISDICRPTDEVHLTRQQVKGDPCCNYAESWDGSFKSDDNRAGLFLATYMSVYGSSASTGRPSGECFLRVRWATQGKFSKPLCADRPGLKVDNDGKEPPCPLFFPVCLDCTRLVRNYLQHRYQNKPSHMYPGPYGYDLLYDALLRRFLRRNRGIDHPPSIYSNPHSDEVEMLGRAVVVRTTAGLVNDEPVDVSGDIFSQIPSLTKWFAKKLQPIDASKENVATSVAVQSARSYQFDNHFLNLPMELLDEITWELDRVSVFALRLTHPVLAERIPLDQAFWCNELTYGEPPLLGYEPLYDIQASRHPGETIGRIDALGEMANRYTEPRTRSKFIEGLEPVAKRRTGIKVHRQDWSKYDWKGLVHLLSKSSEFEEGGSCSDAPPGFARRRRLWGTIDNLLNNAM